MSSLFSRRGWLGASAALPVFSLCDLSAAEPVSVTESQAVRTAAAAGDVKVLKALLDRDRSLAYSRDEQGVSLFRLACRNEQKPVQTLLLESGLKLEMVEAAGANDTKRITELFSNDAAQMLSRSIDGATPLFEAALCGSAEAIEWLAGHGADLDAMTNGRSPLHAALAWHDSERSERMAQMLLGNGANPNAPQSDGLTPLHLAAGRGSVYCTALLARKGADPLAKDSKGRTAADLARAGADQEVEQFLQSPAASMRDVRTSRLLRTRGGAPLVRNDNYGIPNEWIRQFIIFAHFNLERTQALYSRCPDLLNTRAPWDELAVEGCAHTGQATIVNFLLEKGAPLSICTAASLGLQADVITLLREDPARIRERGAHDFPVVCYPALGSGSAEALKALLDAGADPNAGLGGRAALHFACQKGRTELVELLIERGADVNQRARAGVMGPATTPLELALQAKQPRIAELLQKAGARA